MRILVVEDEARIRAFLARAFEAEGFSVDVVEDGEEGLALRPGRQLQFVILDLLLPGRDGLEVLSELQRLRPGLPGADPVRPHRSRHQAARLRAGRGRLPGQALLARRAAGPRPRAAAPGATAPTATMLRAGGLALD